MKGLKGKQSALQQLKTDTTKERRSRGESVTHKLIAVELSYTVRSSFYHYREDLELSGHPSRKIVQQN